MPVSYTFKDSKTADNVAKALLFVARFSKKQALVKFSDSSVGVIWGGSPRSYYIHGEITALDMFKNKQMIRHYGVDHSTIIQVDPNVLGKTLKGHNQERNVTVCVIRPNKLKVIVEPLSSSKRTIVHTLPCEIKTLDDYRSMLIEEIEKTTCRFDTNSYLESIHRFRHILESFVRLNATRIYIWSKQSNQGNDLTVEARTQGSEIVVSMSDLENGFATSHDESRRNEAGVCIDTKKLAFFLSSLFTQKRKVSFEIEHNKCLKITLDNEIQGEKNYQSLLLLHSLNN